MVEETYQFEVYRTLVSLSALIALYFGLGALALWVMFREWLGGRVSGRALLVSERVATAAAIAFVATGVVLANRNVDTLIAEPQLSCDFCAARLPRCPSPSGACLRAVRPRRAGTRITVVRRVRISVDEPVVPGRAARAAAAPRAGRLAQPRPSVSVLPWYTTTTPEGAGVVNLNGLWARGERPRL